MRHRGLFDFGPRTHASREGEAETADTPLRGAAVMPWQRGGERDCLSRKLLDSSRMPPANRPPTSRAFVVAFCAVLAFGIFLRLPANLFEKNGALHVLAALSSQSRIRRHRLRRKSLSRLRQQRHSRRPNELFRHRRSLHRSPEDADRLDPAADAVSLHLLRLHLASAFRNRSVARAALCRVAFRNSLTATRRRFSPGE